MKTSNLSPNSQSNRNRAAAFFAQYHEQGAFYVLLLWCLLPVFMSVYFIIFGVLGKFPTAEVLTSEGLRLGHANYSIALSTYQTAFFILGAVTFCFVLMSIVFCRRSVFSLNAVMTKPWFYLFGILLLWAGITTLRSDYPDYAFRGSGYMCDGFVSYCIYGSVFLCASMLRDEKKRRLILRTYVAVICYLGLIVLIQETADNAFINYCFSARGAAVFNQFNHFGYMLCMAIITSFGLFLYDRGLKKGIRFVYLAAVVFLSYLLVLNDTFGAMLAVLVSLPVVLIVYVCSGRKLDLRVMALVLVLVLVAGICFFALSSLKADLLRNFTQLKTDLLRIFNDESSSLSAGTGRFRLWLETLAKIRERPIAGFGPEGLAGENALNLNLLTHNTYLQITAYLGFIGLLLYLAALLSLARHRLWRLRELDPMMLVACGAAFAYMVSAFVGCPVFNTEPYFWLVLGFAAIPCGNEKPLFCTDIDTDANLTRAPGSYRERLKGNFLASSEEAASSPSALNHMIRTFPQNYERRAFVLLLLWCLLPIVVCADYFISGALGRFPTAEQLASVGIHVGSINYNSVLRDYRTLFFILGAVTLLYALFCMVCFRKQIFSVQSLRQKPWFYLLALLLMWAVVSSFASDYYYHAFAGGFYVRDGLSSYFIYAAVFLCASVIRNEEYRRRLLRVFAAVICCLALIMVIQESVDNDFLNYCFPARRSAVFNHFNHFGYTLCMATICLAGLFLYDRKASKVMRVLYIAGVFFLLYSLTINDTFGAILATLIALPLILILYVRSGRKLRTRTVALVLLLVLAAGGAYFLLASSKDSLLVNFTQFKLDLVKIIDQTDDAGSAGTGRLKLWRETVQRITERPVFGFGPEGFFGKNAISEPSRPHNEYLQIAGFLGIPALLIYLAALFTLAYRQWKHSRELPPMVLVAAGMAAAYLISAFVGNPVFNTAPYLWLFLGLSASGEEDRESFLQPSESTSGNAFLTALFTRLAVLVCLLLCVGAWLSLNNERNNELADLRAMDDANALANKHIDSSVLRDGSISYYWYDKRRNTLTPTFSDAPAPYGLGTGNTGGGAQAFADDKGYMFNNYDESIDYTDKLIVVAAGLNPEGGVQIAMNWYAPEA